MPMTDREIIEFYGGGTKLARKLGLLTHHDRIKMLHTLSTMDTHPESVPINSLVPIKGTPLANNEKVDIYSFGIIKII